MRPFEELVAEAESADVTGWGFGWLAGRATEERPPWGYGRRLADALAATDSALDVDTGGGEVVAEAPRLPPRMVVTEGWAPNARRARTLLEPRGVEVVETRTGAGLPFAARSFSLVTSRHPVRPDWPEIARVLVDGGRYLAQHVGPRSAFELIEFLIDRPLTDQDPRGSVLERAAAERAGLVVDQLRTARCRMEFLDVGAVVWTLRKCVWWVPDFSVSRYEGRLRELDARLRGGTPFVAHSSRHLIEAFRPGEGACPRTGRPAAGPWR